MNLLDLIRIPGEQELCSLPAGKPLALTGLPPVLSAALAARLGSWGRKVLLVMDNDLKASRAADDVRQLLEAQGSSTAADDPEFLPSDGCAFLPAGEMDLTRAAGSQENNWRRLETLAAVTRGQTRILCVGVESLSQRMGRPEPFRALTFQVRRGGVLPPARLTDQLSRMGYERVGLVEGKGQFARRGAIVDVYPPALNQGVRLEFFDDEVDSIRFFDCVSQRSLEDMEEVILTPAYEALLSEEEYPEAARRMAAALNDGGVPADAASVPGASSAAADLAFSSFSLLPDLPPLPDDDDEPGISDVLSAPVSASSAVVPASPSDASSASSLRLSRLMQEAENLQAGLPFRRMRAWLPVLTDHTATLADWFCPDLVILCEPDRLRTRVSDRQEGFAQDLENAVSRREAVSAQSALLAPWEQVLDELARVPMALVTEMLLSLGGIRPDQVISVDAVSLPGYHGQMRLLRDDMVSWREAGQKVFLLSGGASRGDRLRESLKEMGVEAEAVLPATLSRGFWLKDAQIVVVSDADIWGEGYRRAKSRRHAGERISTFTDLKTGDYVVHEDHGVGIFQGITRIQSEGAWRDYLLILYAGNDKLYVPVEQLSRVQRYIGNPSQPPKITRLGGGEWARQKGRVKEGLKKLAFDLKNLYAERSQNTGYAFSPDTAWQREFEDEFPWELTPDQAQSVREITEDMESNRNMDRLLCGDVGYGKTEVSLRAAFKAVVDNKQVALLAPTTILVQQHYHTIQKRFQHTGARVEYLSRFRTPKEQRQVLEKLAAGQVDIIVGTHRLLGKDVKFKDLGLLIVDEEQRFGVAHKEIIKNMKRQVDVLTLSATPIPRTLHMSMTGIRDMSVLETPPEERIPVQTVVTEYSDALIRDAILREAGRSGQVYFLYNRVQSIESFYTRLRALVPEVRIGVAHGQMSEHGLEDVMLDFYNGNYDVLLCTTIIENGLDVPSANTLIVYDAERFGLSQLYQLRGRVGRSNRQAYAYFTVRPSHLLSEAAQQRLEAIREFTEFGAGFRIALRDLEIRGAGNILGPEQHGHLATVGYDMYCRLMEETLAEVSGREVPRELETRVNLRVDAYLPGDYVSEEKQRMEMYKRIASIQTDEDRADVTDELIDRYGLLPPQVQILLDVSQLRALANRVGIAAVSRGKEGLIMRLDEKSVPSPMVFLQALSEADARLALSRRSTATLVLRDVPPSDEQALRDALRVLGRLNRAIDRLSRADASESSESSPDAVPDRELSGKEGRLS